MQIEVHDVEVLPDDVLEVSGSVDGHLVSARGWQSAMTNHFPEDDYKAPNAEGVVHRRKSAKSRPMDSSEKRSYCERLLAEEASIRSEIPVYLNPPDTTLVEDIPLDPIPEPPDPEETPEDEEDED